MKRVAGLPMYDLPEVRAATSAWWQGLAEALRRAGVDGVPQRLEHEPDAWRLWRQPGLLLGQTCGYPLTHGLAGGVRLVATPCYAARGCRGPTYCSLVVVRADDPARALADLRGRPVAVNGVDSFSGWHALRALLAQAVGAGRFFGPLVRSGGHRASLAHVRSGRADFAAIDCVTHALLARHAPGELLDLRVLARTAAAPALPYITSAATDEATLARLRGGLRAALGDPAKAAARAELLLAGIEILPLAAYHRIVARTRQGARVT